MGRLTKPLKLFHAEIRCQGCGAMALNDLRFLEKVLRQAAKAAKMTVVAATMHQFHPQGVTGYLLLAESHLSIHTWPEMGEAVIDLFTCNGKHVKDAIRIFEKALKPRQTETNVFESNPRRTKEKRAQ